MKQNYDIRTAMVGDLKSVKKLLLECNLPFEGLEEHLGTTLVIHCGNEVIGCAALELYQAAALLRSVAVRPDLQGKGLGREITEAALDLARRNKVEEVYLLTETTKRFFSGYGFEPVDRRNVPHPILQSKEFTTLCQETCIAMKMRLLKDPANRPNNDRKD